eukprot:10015501-Alexandrium_andersonii.AAC.1
MGSRPDIYSLSADAHVSGSILAAKRRCAFKQPPRALPDPAAEADAQAEQAAPDLPAEVSEDQPDAADGEEKVSAE